MKYDDYDIQDKNQFYSFKNIGDESNYYEITWYFLLPENFFSQFDNLRPQEWFKEINKDYPEERIGFYFRILEVAYLGGL